MPDDEDKINFFCLQKSYPRIKSLEKDSLGREWLVLENDKKILYSAGEAGIKNDDKLLCDVKESMSQLYPLEPERPAYRKNFAPGRKRSEELFFALYGATRNEVKKNLVPIKFMNSSFLMAAPAAKAFSKAINYLEELAKNNKSVLPFLKPDGAFYWRNIAGERRLSAHSFGIAIDLGARVAPYWRWSKLKYHPLQKSYSNEIVAAMENEGFIWGGKWDAFDLMHFEFRPELICKAKIIANNRK